MFMRHASLTCQPEMERRGNVNMKRVLSLFLPHPSTISLSLSFATTSCCLPFGKALSCDRRSHCLWPSSYMIIGLSVGHNARIGAIAFMPLVMAGIHLVFNGKRILGFGVTAAGLPCTSARITFRLPITYYNCCRVWTGTTRSGRTRKTTP